MRTITQNEKRGLLVALRVFVRALSGERISPKAGEELIERFLETGVSFDALFNKENWGRALKPAGGQLTAAEYVDLLSSHEIEVRELRDEPLWYEPVNGFGTVAEAVHDFFMEVCDRGGKWNIPTALSNLGKAIERHGLQAILSERLITELTSADAKMTYFGYIEAIAKDFKDLKVDDEPTEAQLRRRQQEEAEVSSLIVDEAPEGQGDEGKPQGGSVTVEEPGYGKTEYGPDEAPEEIQPEDEPFPEPEPEEGDGLYGGECFETQFVMQKNPRDLKRESIALAMENYTPRELMHIVRTIEGGENMDLRTIIDRITDGAFNPRLETNEGRNIHQQISSDLTQAFIDCVRTQGLEMDEEIAAHYDVLHDDWDLRTTEVRKLHKLKRLIALYGQDDADLLSAIADVEKLYS